MSDHESVKGKERIMYWEKTKPNPVDYTKFPNPPTFNRHHILPYTAMEMSITEKAGEKENFMSALKYFTKWNNNDNHNLIGLPGVSTYRLLYGKKGEHQRPIPPPGNGMMPCHQTTNWGHRVYNVQVQKDLMNVWGQINITLENHKLDANDVSGTLTSIEGKWKAKVTTGRSPTLDNWKAAMAGDESATPAAYNQFTMVELDDSPI